MNNSGQWKGSDRKGRLPSNWNSLRKAVLKRDRFICQSCGSKATEVDHIIAGDNHRRSNLQSLCSDCHRKKSSSEGVNARKTKRTLRRRPSENHPGLRKTQE